MSDTDPPNPTGAEPAQDPPQPAQEQAKAEAPPANPQPVEHQEAPKPYKIGEKPNAPGSSPDNPKPKKSRDKDAGLAPIDSSALGQISLFLIFLVVGVAIMAAPVDTVWHFVSAMGLTLLYGLIGIFLSWYRRTNTGEHFIDSCYYLGFIFTQAALAISFGKAAFSEDDFTAEQLVPLVATSLGASIIGLVLKVLLDQVVQDRTRVPEEIMSNMESTARLIARDAQEVSDTFVNLTGHMKRAEAASSELFKGAADIQTTSKNQQVKVETALAEITTQVEQLKDELKNAGVAASDGVKALSGDFNQAIKLMSELRGVAASINDIGQDAKTLLGEARRAYSVASDSGRKVDEHVAGLLRKLETEVDGIGGRIESTANAEVAQSLQGLRQQLDQSVRDLRKELSETEVVIAEVVKTFDANLDKLRD